MKKKIIAAVCVLIAVILLVPVRLQYKDGGTVEYKAVLYSIYDVHRAIGSEDEYLDGIIIEILGFKFFDNCKITIYCR